MANKKIETQYDYIQHLAKQAAVRVGMPNIDLDNEVHVTELQRRIETDETEAVESIIRRLKYQNTTN